MIKFSINNIFTIFLLVILSTAALFAQTTKKTKGAGNKSNTSEKDLETTPIEDKSKPKKKVVVILSFDDASLTKANQKIDMGRQIAVLISNEFAARGDFEVIERASIDRVISEQDASYDSRRDPKLASQISKVWSASSVVIGTITEYTITSKTSNYFGVMKRTTTAKVGLAVRLVDVNTGQVQDSANINGKKEKSDTVVGGIGEVTDVTEDLKTQLLTEAAEIATKEAVIKLAKLIDKNSLGGGNPNPAANVSASSVTEEKKSGSTFSKFNPFGKKNKDKVEKTTSQPAPQPTTVSAPEPVVAAATPGKVIAVTPNKIILKGTFANAKVGTKLVVYRVIKEYPDPDNPKIIAFTDTEDVATIEILDIQPSGISAKIITGKEIKSGDLVKLP